MVDCIRDDMSRLQAGQPVSRACIEIPRLGSSVDKKTGVAREIALMLFPPADPDCAESRRRSYIQYTKMISSLKKKYQQQMKEVKTDHSGCGCNPLMVPFKKARLGTAEGLSMYYQLLTSPSQEPVLNPVAMPVEVSNISDLAPFFSYLETGGKPYRVVSDECGDYVQFSKGAFYTDGRIDLCKQVVGPDHIQALMDSILTNESVRHFLLGNNIIGPVGAKAIGDYLRSPDRKSRIETWYLAGNAIDSDSFKHITEGLKSDTDCDGLWLKRNPLRAAGMVHLAALLNVNTSIKTLDLHNTAIMNEGVYNLFDGLQNTTLKYLCLSANGITNVNPLTRYLSKPNGIETLDIGMNPIGDSGAVSIVESLCVTKNVTRLNMNGCRIQQDGLRQILKLLPQLRLELLDLGLYKAAPDLGELPNMFKGCGTDIVNYLRQAPDLRFLYLSESHLSLEDMKIIADYVDTCSTLAYVQMSQYGVTSIEYKSFYARVHNRCQMNCLALYGKILTVDDLRIYRHGPRVRLIDSIYRNNM